MAIKSKIFPLIISLIGFFLILNHATGHAEQPTYDIVFKQGRVIDPETKLDAIRDVGINGKKIAAV